MGFNISVLIPEGGLRDFFITPAVTQALYALGNVNFFSEADYEPEAVKQLLAESHVCVTTWGCPTLDESLLDGAKNLILIAHTGGSVATVVSDYMYDRGIRIISGNDVYAESVAEGTLAYMLAGLRRIPYITQHVENGGWSSLSLESKGLLEKRVGLVGFGAIARYLVGMLRPFRVEVRAYDPFVPDLVFHEYGVLKAESLDEIFSQSDIISNHLPITKETRRIINADVLNNMKEGALFVNTGRGGTVDEHALTELLIAKHISAVLDVFEVEPLPMTSRLRNLDNVILMPHMGGPPTDRIERVGLALAEDIERMKNNQPMTQEIPRDYAFKMSNDRLNI